MSKEVIAPDSRDINKCVCKSQVMNKTWRSTIPSPLIKLRVCFAFFLPITPLAALLEALSVIKNPIIHAEKM